MSLALCMVVKDEINTISGCLDPIIDQVDQVVIIDNGSTDGTVELLQKRYGITPLSGILEEERCFCLSDLRNRAFEEVKTDWILSLDADERLDPKSLKHFHSLSHDSDTKGYFGSWINHINGAPPFEDYKLFLFKQGFKKRGLIHENVQLDIREHGYKAKWLDDLKVEHYPEISKSLAKTKFYKQQLKCALKHDPNWLRYHWFLGYMYFQENRWNDAIKHLRSALQLDSKLMPVECLNSAMVLASIYAEQGLKEDTIATLNRGLKLYDSFKQDFEVTINNRMKPWLDLALSFAHEGKLHKIIAYRFAR